MQRSESQRRDLKRTRTAKACMHCRRRRIKCTGESPCASCVKLGRACVYECGPKKPRISHKGVITTLKAENQRLRADLQGLRMFSSMAGVAPPAGMAHAAAAPKVEELPFVDAYFAFEDAGLFHLVGRERFAAALAGLRSKKSVRAATAAPLGREETALYFAMLAVGASLRRQEVPAMSYANRVRTILAESFDMPSETMVRVSLLLALLHGCMLDVAKEACYLSTALQMLAVLNRVTGKQPPHSLVATAGAMCSLCDAPLPFTTPKDLDCDDELRSVACLITQVGGVLMFEGDGNASEPADFEDMARACAKAASKLELIQAVQTVPSVYPLLINGLHALCLFRLGNATAGTAALHRSIAALPAKAAKSAGPSSHVWAHPLTAFVLRHVVVAATTLGVPGGDAMAGQVHNIAMAWPRAAVHFRGLQSDLRSYDESLRARLDGTEPGMAATSAPQSFMDIVMQQKAAAAATAATAGTSANPSSNMAAAPCGGSPSVPAPSAPSAMPALSLRGDDFGDNFDMCFNMLGAESGVLAAPTATFAPRVSVAKSRELFSFVQMITLALGKPFNTVPKVLSASAAPTRVLVGTTGHATVGSPKSRAASPPFTQATPAASPVTTQQGAVPKPVLDCLALPTSWTAVEFLGESVAAAPSLDCGLTAAVKVEGAELGLGVDKARRGSNLSLLCDADHDDLEELLFNLSPDELACVSLP